MSTVTGNTQPIVPEESDDIFKQAVFEHASFLGINPVQDSEYLWLAEEALLAQLPEEWEQFSDNNGNPYYYNKVTGESVWENPLDEAYRQMFKKLKIEQKHGKRVDPKRATVQKSIDTKVKTKVGSGKKCVGTSRTDMSRLHTDALNGIPEKEVERIQNHRMNDYVGKRQFEFLVQWKSGAMENTPTEHDWVSARFLSDASPNLLHAYCDENEIKLESVASESSKLTENNNEKNSGESKKLTVVELRRSHELESKELCDRAFKDLSNEACTKCKENKNLVQELETELRTLRADCNGVQAASQDRVNSMKAELEEKFSAERKRANEAVKEIHRLSGLLSAGESSRTVLCDQIEDLKAQVKQKDASLNEAKNDASQIRRDVEGGVKAAVQEVREALGREVDRERLRANAAEEQVAVLQNRLDQLVNQCNKNDEAATATKLETTHRLEEQTRELHGLNRQIEQLVADKSTLESTVKKEQTIREELEIQISKEQSSNLALRESIDSQNRQYSRLESDKVLLQEMMDKLKEELRGEVSANLELRQKCAAVETSLETKEREYTREVAQWTRQVDQNQTANLQIVSELKDTIARLEKEASQASERHQLLRQDEDKQANSIDESFLELQQEKAQLEIHNEKLTRDMNQLIENRDSLATTVSSLRKNCDELEDKLGKANGDLMAVMESKGATERQVQRISTEKSVLEAALEKVKLELKSEMNTCEEFRKKVGELEAVLDSRSRLHEREVSSKQQELESILREKTREAEEANIKFKSSQDEMAQLQQQMIEMSKVKSSVGVQAEEIEKLIATKTALLAKQQEKDSEIQQLELRGSELRGKIRTLKEEAQRKETIEGQLHQEIFGERERADDEERRRERFESENKLLEESIASLKSQLSEEAKLNGELRKTRAESVGNSESYKREVERLKSEKESLEVQSQNIQNDLTSALESKEHHIKQLETQLSKLNSEPKVDEVKTKEQVDEAVRVALEDQSKKLAFAHKQAMDEVVSFWENKLQSAQESGDKVDRHVAMKELADAVQQARGQAEKVEGRLLHEISTLAGKLEEEKKRRRVLHNKVVDLQGNIRVYCRVRPVLPHELKTGKGQIAVNFPTDDEIELQQDMGSRDQLDHFEFDKVFTEKASQRSVFDEVDALVGSALDGYNVCIFAYGQTGSGKTHTMNGTPNDPGVNIRALEELFRLADESTQREEFRYSFKISMLEIYNETIRDLLLVRKQGLQPVGAKEAKLDIRKGEDGLFVPGLTVQSVANMDDVWESMKLGTKNRTVGSHNVNEHSSRSHLVLSIHVVGEPIQPAKGVGQRKWVKAKLNLIDLAGSERLTKTAAQGARLDEAKAINKSLSALGNVIGALGSGKRSHVPFRNSKLTYLLQESLSGSSKVLMFVNISPVVWNASESLSSLNFAARCRAVVLGQAKKNVEGADTAKLRKTIDELQAKILLLGGTV